MTRQLGWVFSIALVASVFAAGQVTTPASTSTEKTFVGTAESVTGTEQEVTARLVVTTGNKSDFVAKERLQVATTRPPEPPPPPPQVAVAKPEPAPEPPPPPRPALKHKELPRTDSPLPLYAVLGALLLAVSALTRKASQA